MTKSKNTKRALLMSLLSMVLCVAMLVGSTFAWFTDSVTSGKNQIVAGNLDIELEYATAFNADGTITWAPVTAETELFSALEKDGTSNLWEPGHTEYVCLRVSNVGTLALKYQFTVNVYGDAEGKTPEKTYINKDGDEFKLSNSLVFIQKDGASEVADRESLWISDAAAEKKAMGDLSGLGLTSDEMRPGDEEIVTLAVYMPTQVGNEANYKTDTDRPEIYLGLSVNATQTPYEEDSFGNDYDEAASFSVSTTEELVEALDNAQPGDEISVAAGRYEMPEEYTIAEGVSITGVPGTVLYLNGGKKDITNPSAENGITEGMLLKNDNITISNVTIEGDIVNKISYTDYASYNSFIRITGNNVTLDNVTLDSKTNDSPIVIASTKSDDNVITIKNCKITAAFKGIHIVDGTKGTINIENCDIDGIYPFNVNTESALKLSVKNSVLNGWTSYGKSVILAEFDNCEFGLGHGQNDFVPYSDTVLTNCTFNGTKMLAVRGKPGFRYEFINCTYSGTVVTPENIKTTITTDSDIWNYASCFVNGVQIPND